MKNKEIQSINGELILTGKAVGKLPNSTKKLIAGKVVCLLKKNKKYMLQFSQEDLIKNFFDTGDAVILINKNELIGFAKNMPWPGENEKGQKVYEFGSWLVEPKYMGLGYGHHLAFLAADSLKNKDKNAQLIAICDCDKNKPINILKELGAVETQKPSNVNILLGEGKAKVVILDLSVINY